MLVVIPSFEVPAYRRTNNYSGCPLTELMSSFPFVREKKIATFLVAQVWQKGPLGQDYYYTLVSNLSNEGLALEASMFSF